MEDTREVLVGDVVAASDDAPTIATAEDHPPIKPTTSSQEVRAPETAHSSDMLPSASMAMGDSFSENHELVCELKSLDGEFCDFSKHEESRVSDGLPPSPSIDAQQTLSSLDFLDPISVTEGMISVDHDVSGTHNLGVEGSSRDNSGMERPALEGDSNGMECPALEGLVNTSQILSGGKSEVMDTDAVSTTDIMQIDVTNVSIEHSNVMPTEAINQGTARDAELLDPGQSLKPAVEALCFDDTVSPSGQTSPEGGFSDPQRGDFHESCSDFQKILEPLEISGVQDIFVTDSAAEITPVGKELKPMKEDMDEREVAVHAAIQYNKEGLDNEDESQILQFDTKVKSETGYTYVSSGDVGVLPVAEVDSKVVTAGGNLEANMERQTETYHDSSVNVTTAMRQIAEVDRNSQHIEVCDGHGMSSMELYNTKPDDNLDDTNVIIPGSDKDFEDSEVVNSSERHSSEGPVNKTESELVTDGKDVVANSFVQESMVDLQPSETMVEEWAGTEQDIQADSEVSPEKGDMEVFPESAVMESGMELGQSGVHQDMEAAVPENAVSEGRLEVEHSGFNGLEPPGPDQDTKADLEASLEDAKLEVSPESSVLEALSEIAVPVGGVDVEPSVPKQDIRPDAQASPENAELEALPENAVPEGVVKLEQSESHQDLPLDMEDSDMEASPKKVNMQSSPKNGDLENAVPEGGLVLEQLELNQDLGTHLRASPEDADMAASPENALSELEPSSFCQDMQADTEASPEKAVLEQQPKKRGRKPGKKVAKKVEKEVDDYELESPRKQVVESDQKRELRKRGRKPGPKIAQKEEEDVCFVCFDGGDLILCDKRSCPKAYHVECTGREADFFQKKGQWFCGWHVCSQCSRSATVNCYMCPSALCSNCVKGSNFLCVKKGRGLCQGCYALVHMIEHNETINGDPVQVDFTDKETYEGLFREYWQELKAKYSLSSIDLVKACKAKERGGVLVEGGNDDVDEVMEDEDGNSSDSEEDRPPPTRHTRLMKRKRLTRNAVVVEDENASEFEDEDESEDEIEGESTPKRGRTRAPEFDGGWCSKELADLIQSLKEDPKKQLPLFGVKKLLWRYIDENKLTNPRRRGQILCDERLQKIYGKKHVGRFEMMKLISLHLASPNKLSTSKGTREWQPGADNDAVELYESDENVTGKRKPKRKADDNKRTKPHPSDYAAVNLKNINLIYLKRSVLDELRNDPELESKAIGAFVRIRIPGSVNKSDACYRLVQVVGVKQIYDAVDPEKVTDVILEILNLHKREEITADLVSNQELVEEECKRLRQSVRCGFIKAMTVGELEERARALREAKVKDWFEFELLRLSHLRDRASEKGRKKELRECVEKLQLLSSPEERERQMRAPFDIDADPCMDPDYESEDEEPPADDSQGDIHATQSAQEKGFQSRFPDKSKITGGLEKHYNLWGTGGSGDSYKKPQDSYSKPSFWGQKDAGGGKDNIMQPVEPNAQGGPNSAPQISTDKNSLLGPGKASWGDGARPREQSSGWNQGGGYGRKDGRWTVSSGGGGQGGGWKRDEYLDHGRSNVSRFPYNQAASAEIALGPMLSPIRTPPSASNMPVAAGGGVAGGGGSGGGYAVSGGIGGGFTAGGGSGSSHAAAAAGFGGPAAMGPAAPANPVASTAVVAVDSEKEKVWCYLDPTRTVQGPFTMEQLRKWEKTNLFPLDLRIWRVTESQDASILLSDALAGRFHNRGPLQKPPPFNNQAVGPTQGTHANGFPVSSVQGLNTNNFPAGPARGSSGNNFLSGPTPGPIVNPMGPQQQRPITQQSLPSTNPLQGPNAHSFPSGPMQGPNSHGFTSGPVQGPNNVHGFVSGPIQQGPSVQGFPSGPSQGAGAQGFPPAAAQGPYGNNFMAPPPQGPHFNSSLPGPMQGPSVTGYPPNIPQGVNVMPGQTQAPHVMPGQLQGAQFNNAPPGQGNFVNNYPTGSMPGPINHPPPQMGQGMPNPGRDLRQAPMPNRPPANEWPERPGPNQHFMGHGPNMGGDGGAWRGGPSARGNDDRMPQSRGAWRSQPRHDDREVANRGHVGRGQDFRGANQYQGHDGRSTQRKDLMCKYYSRGLCRKGEACDFRHH